MQYRFMMVAATCILVGSALGQVNLPEGFEIVEFAGNDKMTRRPVINNCGEIVYVKDRKEDSRVYLYDNGKITRLTDDDGGRLVSGPDINDAGTVVWMRGFFNEPDTWKIVMLKESEQTIAGKGSAPSINSFERMAWQLFRKYSCHSEVDIVFYDGESIIRITDDRFNDQGPQINDSDLITWSHGDFCVTPWIADIMFYEEGNVTKLNPTTGQYVDHAINNRGQVAWLFKQDIYLWENGQIRKVISGPPSGSGPRINEVGDIFFQRWNEETRSHDAWLYRVSGEQEPTLYRLTDDDVDNVLGNINDWGEAAWRWLEDPRNGNWGGGIRLLRRIRSGDTEFDEDIDLLDYAVFADCMTGPGRVDRLCACRFLDIDHDGDVDLADSARFQNGFTGQ